MDFQKLKSIRHKKELVLIGTVVLCVMIIGSVFYSNVIHTAKQYKEAVSLFNEYNYSEANKLFGKLDDYKDSKGYAEKCSANLLESELNHAYALYDKGEYEQAMEILEELPDYNGSKQLYEQCEMMIEQRNIYDKTDPQNSAYYKVVRKLLTEYGKPKLVETGSGYTVTGVNLIELIDFNSDGINEMVIGKRASAGSAGSWDIYAFYGGKAHKVYSGEYTGYSGNSTIYAFKTTPPENSYGNLLHIGKEASGKTLKFTGMNFKTVNTWEKNGSSYLLNGNKVSKSKYYTVAARNSHFRDYTNSEPLGSYTLNVAGISLYSTSHLSDNAANDLKSRINTSISTLKASYERQ